MGPPAQGAAEGVLGGRVNSTATRPWMDTAPAATSCTGRSAKPSPGLLTCNSRTPVTRTGSPKLLETRSGRREALRSDGSGPDRERCRNRGGIIEREVHWRSRVATQSPGWRSGCGERLWLECPLPIHQVRSRADSRADSIGNERVADERLLEAHARRCAPN